MYEGLEKLAEQQNNNNRAALYGGAGLAGVGGTMALANEMPKWMKARGKGYTKQRKQLIKDMKKDFRTNTMNPGVKAYNKIMSKKNISEKVRAAKIKRLEKKVMKESKTRGDLWAPKLNRNRTAIERAAKVEKWFKRLSGAEKAMLGLGVGGAAAAGTWAYDRLRNRNK